MDERTICALCLDASDSVEARPAVPREFLSQAPFDIDPLGSAGAEFLLCAECRQVLARPMLLAEDAEAFAKAVSLHRESHPTSGSREAFAARIRLWHRALHLGLRALVGELEATPLAAPPRSEADQLGLFTSRTARLAKVLAALEAGDLLQAAVAAEEIAARFDLPEALYLARHLPEIAASVEGAGDDAGALAGVLEDLKLDPALLDGACGAALRRQLHARIAEVAERRALHEVRGQLTGWHWREAGQLARAEVSLAAAIERGVGTGRALALLGDLAFEQGRVADARERYRRAACEDPEAFDAEAVADPAVQALVDEARELDLDPPVAWLPMVGYATGVFWLPPEPAGQGTCREFHEALLSGRKAGGIEARRKMKELAPLLFGRLRDEGKL